MKPVGVPTERQAQILIWVSGYFERNLMWPTLREIGLAFGIRSTNGVNDCLRALAHKGFVQRHRHLSRGTVVPDWVRYSAMRPRQLVVDATAALFE